MLQISDTLDTAVDKELIETNPLKAYKSSPRKKKRPDGEPDLDELFRDDTHIGGKTIAEMYETNVAQGDIAVELAEENVTVDSAFSAQQSKLGAFSLDDKASVNFFEEETSNLKNGNNLVPATDVFKNLDFSDTSVKVNESVSYSENLTEDVNYRTQSDQDIIDEFNADRTQWQYSDDVAMENKEAVDAVGLNIGENVKFDERGELDDIENLESFNGVDFEPGDSKFLKLFKIAVSKSKETGKYVSGITQTNVNPITSEDFEPFKNRPLSYRFVGKSTGGSLIKGRQREDLQCETSESKVTHDATVESKGDNNETPERTESDKFDETLTQTLVREGVISEDLISKLRSEWEKEKKQ